MAASWSKVAAVYRATGLKLRRLSSTKSTLIFQCTESGLLNYAHQLANGNVILESKCYSTHGHTKKDCTEPMAKSHDPSQVETGWYDWWVQQGFFLPHLQTEGERASDQFVMLLPPPNVTGDLHLGHALTGAVEDAIVRWHRMKGFRTFWLPGTDHAGIATHVVVEKKLYKEKGKTRFDLGREEFLKEIWKWKQEHGDTISKQMKTLGLSLDWSKDYFTMDEDRSRAVTEAFCHLYEKGRIYRDKRMINWSSALRSSLSEIEVNNIRLERPTTLKVPGMKEGVEFGVISRFAYPVVDSEEQLIVATTRLETMLADTAVAVNPSDPRYSHLVGQKVSHPIDKGRQLPVIADSFVDMEFGTGAVKITPGHDNIDYEIGRRHNLDVIEMLEDDGTVRKDIPVFGGQGRFEARKNLREALCLLGYYCGERDHVTVLPVCSRTGDIIEPRLKEQWFLNCRDMAQKAIQVVESGQLTILPDYNARVWFEWLKNIQEWCLSRQLWWGHRIPVYTCMKSGIRTCARSEEEAKVKLATELKVDRGVVEVKQDEDVLDTWFSSSLLPFSGLGWPVKTEELQKYFPQQLLETGQDILFFWVARMVMMSLELTGQLPFDKILLHGMLRDSQGRKMSKSLGNVIDPLDVIRGISLESLQQRLDEGNLPPDEVTMAKEGQKKDFPHGIARCGSDALRLTLCSYNVKNMDINFDVSHAESRMRFCNKIWQSFRFLFSKFSPEFSPQSDFKLSGVEDGTDLWILNRLSHMVQSCDSHFKTYDLHLAVSALQQFWYQEFCDVYLEAVKPIFQSEDTKRQEAVQQILFICAETFVLSMAPFMPFICEELYQRLPSKGGKKAESVCIAQYPVPEQFPWINPHYDSSMDHVLEIVHQAQKLRKDYNCMGTRSKLFVQTADPMVCDALASHKTCLLSLSRSGDVSLISPNSENPPNCTTAYVNPDLKVFIELKGSSLDMEKELNRLNNKQKKLEGDKFQLKAKLENLEVKGKGDYAPAIKLKTKLVSIDKDLKKVVEMVNTLSNIRQGV